MSSPATFAVFAVALIAFTLFYLFFYRSWRRQRELEEPFPGQWRQLLEANVPLYQRLSVTEKRALEQKVQLFLAEKDFYGCDGLEMNDRVRVTIAGHACLLLLHRPFSDYDDVRSILVYPDVYRVKHAWHHGMIVHESEEVRAGEASGFGQVVLAWSQCLQASTTPNCSHNVILHEFAHQLDYLDGSPDGAPPLSGQQAEHWQTTMTAAYEDLREAIEHHHRPWLDPYGATEPAEFFAVLTEAFFQQPRHLSRVQPEVYRTLQDFYRLDPLSFIPRHP